jgi:molybdopterin/thiamine biosynthesis adenylyltransferase
MKSHYHLSREIAAGYDPDLLARMRVLLIGTGALGQNIGLNLALCQVGQICLNDMDQFEAHNAARSPCFPTPSERRRWGNSKARVVAEKLRRLVSWSQCPKVVYADGPIQQFGDAYFRDATIVVSAVDSNATRAYIGLMARKHGRPLVEGGFDGADVSYCVLSNEGDGPCWRCHQQVRIVDQLRFSCTARATEAERVGFVPATQPTAATLAALMAEAVIQLGHENQEIVNRRIYANIRSARTTTIRLARDEHCQGRHAWPKSEFTVSVDRASLAADLLSQMAKRFERPCVILPHRFVVSAPCAECLNLLDINQPEWALFTRPRCKECGGSWDLRNGGTGDSSLPVEVYTFLSEETPALLDLPLHRIGILPGSLLEITCDRGRTCLVDISGSPNPISKGNSHDRPLHAPNTLGHLPSRCRRRMHRRDGGTRAN